MAYVRTVKTASGAVAVQIVHSSHRGSRKIEHLGSAHDEGELEALKVAARQRLAAGQAELDLGLSVSEAASSGGPLEIASSRMAHLWEALCRAYEVLGFDKATGGDVVFRDLVLARIIEPTSKEDSIRVLSEAGVAPASYRTIKHRLPGYAEVTKENRTWFAGLIGDLTYPADWRGLNFVDGLAAEFPDVVDFYVNDGADRLAGVVGKLTDAIGLTAKSAGGGLVTPCQVVDELKALQPLLDTDPHFRYAVSLDPVMPTITPDAGLIASVTQSIPGDPADFVTVKIYPRVAAALEFRPIPISLTFAAEPGSELHQKLGAFDKYGIPFVAPHGTVSGTLDLPGGLDGSSKGGSIRIGPSPDAGEGYRLRLVTMAADGTVAQQVILDMQPVSVGFDRTGIRAHGTDQDEVFDVQILTDLKTEVVNFSLSTRELTGRHPDDLFKSLRFLESFRAPNKLVIAAPRGPITNPPIDLGAARTCIDPQSVEANLQIVTLLADLQDYTTEQLLVPAAKAIDRSTVLAWRSALRLLSVRR